VHTNSGKKNPLQVFRDPDGHDSAGRKIAPASARHFSIRQILKILPPVMDFVRKKMTGG
jgi:hypothetical protein